MNDDIISLLKITHVINVTLHVKNKFENIGVKYLNIQIDDTSDYKITQYFKTAYEFIENTLSEGELRSENNDNSEILMSGINMSEIKENDINFILEGIDSWTFKNKIIQILFKENTLHYQNNNRILIHCSMGISRSPTIAIMYTMKKFRMKFEQAYDFIKFQRDKSTPICSFLAELEEFEKNEYNFD